MLGRHLLHMVRYREEVLDFVSGSDHRVSVQAESGASQPYEGLNYTLKHD